MGANGRQEMRLDEASQEKIISLDVLRSNAEIDGDIVLLLQHEDGQAVVGDALLRVRWYPREQKLVGWGQSGQVDGALGGRDGDVGCEEVTPVVEAVRLEIGHVGIDHGDGDEALAALKGLHRQPTGVLAQFRIHKVAGLDVLEFAGADALGCVAVCEPFAGIYPGRDKGEFDVHGGLAGWENVRYHLHLLDALDYDQASILSPLPVRQIAIDGLVHVTWPCLVSVDDDTRRVLPYYPAHLQIFFSPRDR